MANTLTTSKNFITISSRDSDYDHGEVIALHSIRFNPGGADTCVILDTDANGATVFKVEASGTSDEHVEYYNGALCRPFLDFSAGSYSANAEVTLILQRVRR